MTLKLLLADDNVTVQRLVELTCAGQGIDVATAGDGDVAIARIPIERPDIILASIAMPGRSGYDVAAFVKDDPTLAHIPVLLLSGAFEPVDEARAVLVKCDGVVVKPFEPRQVIARVRGLVAGATGAMRTTSGVPRLAEPHSQTAGAQGKADPLPPPAVNVVAADESLDEMFDRLDKAFAARGSGPFAAATRRPDVRDGEGVGERLGEDSPESQVPTVDAILSGPPATTPR